MSIRRRVLVLDNAVMRDVYRPFTHWRQAIETTIDEPIEIVRARCEDPLPSLRGITHVIVSGSEASILDDEPWVPPRLELIRRTADTGIALLGSCHGHQLIALALGGEVGRAATPELGWIQLELDEDDPMFRGARLPLWVFASHFDEVTAMPQDFVTTASTDRCRIHAYRHASERIWGVQSHPEIDPVEGQALLDAFRAVDPRAAAASLDLPARDTDYISALIRGFLGSA